MDKILSLLILTIVVEKSVGIVKDIFGKRIKKRIVRFVSLVLSIALVYITNTEILKILKLLPQNVNNYKIYFDYLVTGIIISRGSNVVHDLFSLIEKLKQFLNEKK